MRIAVIGKGRVASHLIGAFRAVGHVVTECGGRKRLCPVPDDADVVVISVKDDAIQEVAEELRESSALVLHTAGSVAMDVILARHRGVMYPLQTFTKGRELDFRQIPLFIEASDESDMNKLQMLAQSISDKVMYMNSKDRKTMHLAAVFCCNFVNHMYDVTAQLLREKDIPFGVMLPLIDETAAKVHEISPHDAQTGPAVRWDEKVIRQHIDMLPAEQMKMIYRELSDSIRRGYENEN